MRLRDVLVDRPKLLLAGINPGLRSAALGHHFAGQASPFWRLLRASGVIPIALTSVEEHRLAKFGIALTNLCPRATATAGELRDEEIERGIRVLNRKIERLRPRVVAFVGLEVDQRFFRRKAAGGPGPRSETIYGAKVFVLPDPGGVNADYPGWPDKLAWFSRLREFLDELCPEPAAKPRARSASPDNATQSQVTVSDQRPPS